MREPVFPWKPKAELFQFAWWVWWPFTKLMLHWWCKNEISPARISQDFKKKKKVFFPWFRLVIVYNSKTEVRHRDVKQNKGKFSWHIRYNCWNVNIRQFNTFYYDRSIQLLFKDKTGDTVFYSVAVEKASQFNSSRYFRFVPL